MQEMLKSANKCYSKKLNTIMETIEYVDENDNFAMDALPDTGNMHVSETNYIYPTDKPSRYRAANILQSAFYENPREMTPNITHSGSERQTHQSTAPLHCREKARRTVSAPPTYWREKANVAVVPAGIVRSSSEPSPLKSEGQDISEVQHFFPEFFKDSNVVPYEGCETFDKHSEHRKNTQDRRVSVEEDPLVQSWLDLFGKNVYK